MAKKTPTKKNSSDTMKIDIPVALAPDIMAGMAGIITYSLVKRMIKK